MATHSDIILIEHFLRNHPIDAVRIIEKLNIEDIVQFLDSREGALAGQVVTHLNVTIAIHCLQSIDIHKVAEIIDNLPLDFVSMLVRNMPKNFQKLLLATISKETSSFLNKTLYYPEDAVGAIMDPFLFIFYEDIMIGEALKLLKKYAEKNLYYIYILSRNHKLAGVTTISQLFRAKSDQLLSSIMNRKVITILADIKYKSIVNHPGWQEYHALPVVDNKNIFQGILRNRVLSRLDEASAKRHIPQNLIAASSALGELYRLGIVSLIRGASDLYSETGNKR